MSGTKLDALAGLVGGPPSEFDVPPPDPIGLFRDWLAGAVKHGVQEPTLLALATADPQGHASNRTIRTLDVTADGLVFTSHTGSQKGRELAATAWASGVLYWRETKQQVILTGPVQRLSCAESDELWADRPIATQAMSAVSVQSARLDDEEALRCQARHRAAAGEQLPRPAEWSGYRLVPRSVEFWRGSPDGLHRRLRYDWTDDGWITCRLQP
jgi:dihydrophenazinedicarboxylate synthase